MRNGSLAAERLSSTTAKAESAAAPSAANTNRSEPWVSAPSEMVATPASAIAAPPTAADPNGSLSSSAPKPNTKKGSIPNSTATRPDASPVSA